MPRRIQTKQQLNQPLRRKHTLRLHTVNCLVSLYDSRISTWDEGGSGGVSAEVIDCWKALNDGER
jgi:hypothetical protein